MTSKKKPKQLPKKYIEHFESLGYVVDLSDSYDDQGGQIWTLISHEYFRDSLVSISPNGIVMFMEALRLNKNAKKHPEDLLFFINQLNQNSGFTLFMVERKKEKLDELHIRAFYTGLYEEKAFNLFMNEWHRDKVEALGHSPIVEKFLVQNQELSELKGEA